MTEKISPESSALTRRPMEERIGWHVYYTDVCIGWIAARAGVPHESDQWAWSCGFYPGAPQHSERDGSAVDFEEARVRFESAWRDLAAVLTEANLKEWRDQRDWTERKYAMGAGRKVAFSNSVLADAVPLRCRIRQPRPRRQPHPRSSHHGRAEARWNRTMKKMKADLPWSDPEKAARRLLKYAQEFKPIQEGRIYVEVLNRPFIDQDKGTPAQYTAGMKYAKDHGWLEPMHEGGTFTRITEAGRQIEPFENESAA
ncbi:hypothetical protein HAP47_0022485 [Bradyrhizobium sp. 41S5]|uniref:hypothetical protein n=1 Tax=Bradyrhizobium sp. 41S5 TaxID=1404443 RepID=UPI00156A8626|nr:hypothetical protein [Bradyrhizobium sp. 41S5]UFX42032.1 hypothetical protein HAP47_0022485 [Bradyrhizobium sp. 41S5]